MQYRRLGRTELGVSLLSLGTGGASVLGQHKGLSQHDQDALVRRCLDLGINLFDTSADYMDSEAILGRALDGTPRDSYSLVTKWSHDDDGRRTKDPEELVGSVERSLRRLRTDHVDVMMFHGVLSSSYDDVVDRYYPVIQRLRDGGKLRFTGLSTRFREDAEHHVAVRALSEHPQLWDTVMLKYGILNQRAAREALPLAIEHDAGIINMAAVRVKLPDPDLLDALMHEWKRRGDVPAGGLPEGDPLGWLVHDDVDSVISAGYKFAADHPGVSTVLTGTSSIEHLEQNAAALEKPNLPAADKRRLVELFEGVAEYV